MLDWGMSGVKNDYPEISWLTTSCLTSPRQYSDRLCQNEADFGDYLSAVSWPYWNSWTGDAAPSPLLDKAVVTINEDGQDDTTSIAAYATRCGADFIELTGVTQGLSSLEKFRIGPYVQSYGRTIFIDSSYSVSASCPSLFDEVPSGQIGLYDESNDIIEEDGEENLRATKYHFFRRMCAYTYKMVSANARADIDRKTELLIAYSTKVMVFSQEHAAVVEPYDFKNYLPTISFWIENRIDENNFPVYLLESKYNSGSETPASVDLIGLNINVEISGVDPFP